LGALVTEVLLLGKLDVNVARVLHLMSQVFDGRVQPRRAHRRRAHIHTTALLPEVQRHAQNSYFHAAPYGVARPKEGDRLQGPARYIIHHTSYADPRCSGPRGAPILFYRRPSLDLRWGFTDQLTTGKLRRVPMSHATALMRLRRYRASGLDALHQTDHACFRPG